jgi:hypothetical protein
MNFTGSIVLITVAVAMLLLISNWPFQKRLQLWTALVTISIRREDSLMEYRGIRYTIRAGIEPGQCVVVIHPQGVEVGGKKQVLTTISKAQVRYQP